MQKQKTIKRKSSDSRSGSQTALFMLAALPILLFFMAWLRKQRAYLRLEEQQTNIIKQFGPRLIFRPRDTFVTPSFVQRLAVIPDFLPAKTFELLKSAILEVGNPERTFLPAHKQGGTVAYETLHQAAPAVVAFFNSPFVRQVLSDIVGEPLQPTPINDQSSCSLLFYTKPGDHIGWHYDHNFYNGRHFTVLLPIVNQQNANHTKPSSAQLMVRRQGREEAISSAPNTLIIFEGAHVLHKVTRLGPDETRVMLSMTFCTKPHASPVKALARRFKDVAFFGIRALWT